MQVDHKDVPKAVKGDAIGTKISQHAREHDKVFKVIP
jgi:hypothetical protein